MKTQTNPRGYTIDVQRIISVVFLFLWVSFAQAGPVGYVPDRLLVKAKAHVDESEIQSEIAGEDAIELGTIPNTGVRVLQISPNKHSRALQALRHNPHFEFVEPDYIFEPGSTPNDPSFGNQWYLTKIAAPTAWDTTPGDSSIIIAILDSGVDPTHPDLVTKLVPGWNTYDNNADTSDVYGHGTKTAGTAAATGNNGVGVASVAMNCAIMPVRISDLDGFGYSTTIASGLTWAADHGARVANISFAVSGVPTVSSAAKYFQSKGGVVTVSAGNDGTVLSTADDPNVLTVSATDSNDNMASWSNTGNLIDLAAPGVSIYTTVRGGTYGSVSGTSFSAPTVAGVAGLVLSANPALTGAQVQDILIQSADDMGTAGWDIKYGWGRVNAANAVALALNTSALSDITPPTVGITSPGDNATVSGSVTIKATASDNTAVAGVVLSVDGVTVATLTAAPYEYVWNSASAADGSHAIVATALDAAGNDATDVVAITVDNAPDTVSPTVTILSPANGTKVKNNVSVTVNATDNRAVTKVVLYVDGKATATSTVAPFTTTWNCRKASTGTHQLQTVAYDTAGNTGTSAAVSVVK